MTIKIPVIALGEQKNRIIVKKVSDFEFEIDPYDFYDGEIIDVKRIFDKPLSSDYLYDYFLLSSFEAIKTRRDKSHLFVLTELLEINTKLLILLKILLYAMKERENESFIHVDISLDGGFINEKVDVNERKSLSVTLSFYAKLFGTNDIDAIELAVKLDEYKYFFDKILDDINNPSEIKKLLLKLNNVLSKKLNNGNMRCVCLGVYDDCKYLAISGHSMDYEGKAWGFSVSNQYKNVASEMKRICDYDYMCHLTDKVRTNFTLQKYKELYWLPSDKLIGKVFSCCERKIIAKIYETKKSFKPYKLKLYIKYVPCDFCISELNNVSKIYCFDDIDKSQNIDERDFLKVSIKNLKVNKKTIIKILHR